MGIIAAGCGNNAETDKLRQENEELAAQNRKDSLYIQSITNEMNELYVNLDSMRAREERIRQMSARMRSGSVGGQEGGLSIDQSFAEMEKLNAENQRKIASLQAQLKKAGKENALVKKMVEELQKTVADKDKYIGDLQIQISDLQQEVEGWKSKYAATEQEKTQVKEELTQTQDVMSTVYYAIGTKRELSDRGIIDKRGLFGNIKELNENLDDEKFTKIDMRTISEIPIGKYKAKRIELLPERPANSFSLEENGENVTLKITNPQVFWKSKYVAIVVK
jgi:chromosome segregation ATPase